MGDGHFLFTCWFAAARLVVAARRAGWREAYVARSAAVYGYPWQAMRVPAYIGWRG